MRNQSPRRSRTIPRWSVPIMWAAGFLLVHVIAPWSLSLIGPRWGWSEGLPGAYNMIGFAPSAAGLITIIWLLILHFQQYETVVPLDSTPRFLLRGGPYAVSRNPSYLSVLLIWAGWTLFYGSPAVLAGTIIFFSALAFLVVPREEKQLEAQFGEAYLQYKRTVPRWIGKRRP